MLSPLPLGGSRGVALILQQFYLGLSMNPERAPCLDVSTRHCVAWERMENTPPQVAPPSIPLDPLLQTGTLFSDVLFHEGLGRGPGAWEGKHLGAQVITGEEWGCPLPTSALPGVRSWAQAGLRQGLQGLGLRSWGRGATALPLGPGRDVTLMIAIISRLLLAPQVLAPPAPAPASAACGPQGTPSLSTFWLGAPPRAGGREERASFRP